MPYYGIVFLTTTFGLLIKGSLILKVLNRTKMYYHPNEYAFHILLKITKSLASNIINLGQIGDNILRLDQY